MQSQDFPSRKCERNPPLEGLDQGQGEGQDGGRGCSQGQGRGQGLGQVRGRVRVWLRFELEFEVKGQGQGRGSCRFNTPLNVLHTRFLLYHHHTLTQKRCRLQPQTDDAPHLSYL